MTLPAIVKWGLGVGAALGAAGAVLVGARGEVSRGQLPSSAEVQELRGDVKDLVRKLEAFDRRLSYMEGASRTRRAPEDP